MSNSTFPPVTTSAGVSYSTIPPTNASSVLLDGQLVSTSATTVASIVSGNANGASISSAALIAFDTQQNLWIANYANNNILKVASGTTTVTSVVSGNANGAVISNPVGLAFDNQQNLWISNQGAGNILKVASGTTTATIIANGGSLFYPVGIAFDAQQNLWIAESTGFIIKIASGTTTPNNQSFTGATVSTPQNVAFDNQQNLWIMSAGNASILKVASGTTVAVKVVSGNTIGASPGPGLAFDTQQNIWVSNANSKSIYKVASGITTAVSVLSGNANGASIVYPYGIAFDTQQNLWISNYNTNNILKTTNLYPTLGSGTYTTTITGTGVPTYLYAGTQAINVTLSGSGINSTYTVASGTVVPTAVVSGATTATITASYTYWLETFTDPTNSGGIPYGTAVDSSGNVYLAVSSSTGTPSGRILVSKYNNLGVLQWQIYIASPYFAAFISGPGLTVDSSGNVYVAGCIYNVSAQQQQFIAKYNSTGTIQWQRSLTDAYTTHSARNVAVAVDSSGNVCVCGYGLNASNQSVGSIVQYNSAGTLQWQRTLLDAGTVHATQLLAITVDSSNNIYVSGRGRNSSNLSIQIIAKYNSTGTIQWQRTLTDAYSTPGGGCYGIAVDSSANVYVCGYGLNASNQTVQSISKWDTSGNLLWQRTFTDPASAPSDFAAAIAIDSSANIYVGGYGRNTSGTFNNASISKWDTSGNLLWQRTMQDTYSTTPDDRVYSIAADSNGNLYCGVGIFNNSGTQVNLVTRLPSNGTLTGTYVASNGSFGIAYTNSSWTAATSTWTAATSTWTAATSTWTNATSTATTGVGTGTNSSINILNLPATFGIYNAPTTIH